MSPSPPRFQRAPVTETVLALQFERLPGLHAGRLGAFWSSLGPDWDRVSEAAALGQVIEPIEDDDIWLARGFEIRTHPSIRLRARHRDDQRMLQLENGWLTVNWKRPSADSPYAHYQERRATFDDLRARFDAFLGRDGLGPMVPTLWEVTYVNSLPRGELWRDAADWPAIFPALLGSGSVAAGGLQTLAGEWIWRLEDGRGRLHAELEHRRRVDAAGDDREVLMIKLWARGPVNEQVAVDAGLDLGHDAIVRSFSEITSEAARKHWGES